jgi:hypothetical protein
MGEPYSRLVTKCLSCLENRFGNVFMFVDSESRAIGINTEFHFLPSSSLNVICRLMKLYTAFNKLNTLTLHDLGFIECV